MMDNSATKYEQCAQEDIFEPANIKVKKKSNAFLYFAVISVNFMALGAGSIFSWTSPVLPKLKSDDLSQNPLGHKISATEESLIASIQHIGALLTPFVNSQCADRFGRKKSLLIFSAPMIISYLTLAFAETVYLYYVARTVLGLGASCIFTMIPMYVVEIAKDTNRGRLGCFVEIFISAGEVTSVVLGVFFGVKWMCVLLTVPFLVSAATFLTCIPESPYFNFMDKNEAKAEINLKKFRRSSDVKEELKDIESYVKDSMDKDRSFRDLFKTKSLTRAVLISIGLTFCQDMCGIVLVVFFTEELFLATDSQIPASIPPIIVSLVKFSFTCVASGVIEKSGRRLLLLISQTGMLVTLTLLGLYFFLRQNNFYGALSEDGGWYVFVSYLPLVCAVLYMVFYSTGCGPVPWTLIGEMFPPDVKAVASTIPIVFNNIFCYISSFMFPFFVISFGMAATVWFFAAMCVLGLVFTVLWVPETKGRSLQEIQEDLGK